MARTRTTGSGRDRPMKVFGWRMAKDVPGVDGVAADGGGSGWVRQ